ncbi:MAG: outer membrane protein assembly factor BamC [Burkholderiales bacterium]|nr:outer membrane protein assembly factor BamC [Burkholderiales bacterium]
MSKRNLFVAVAAPLAAVYLTACGSFGTSGKSTDYRSQGGKIPSLEVPPDLTSPVVDDRFVIPDSKATTFSTYNRDRGVVSTTGTAVLPLVNGARIERSGEQRWLVVKTSPDKAWPVIKEFWTGTGFILKRESPEVGIMETDWAENRAKIPMDFIRSAVGRVLDGLYDSGYRDKFRTRLEPGTEAGTTDVYISHRGLEEIYTNADKSSTGWQPRQPDKELEAEMLARLMAKFGISVASDKANTVATTGSVTVARAFYTPDSSASLKVNEPFDRAWRRVGLALDRIGFTVEDRDRSKGLFFVRYIDPDAEAKASGGQKGFLDKLAFWRKDDPASKPQYRIYVAETAGISDVVVQGADGKPENSSTSKRILSLLLEQLR